jgi:hypothetical protein
MYGLISVKVVLRSSVFKDVQNILLTIGLKLIINIEFNINIIR